MFRPRHFPHDFQKTSSGNDLEQFTLLCDTLLPATTMAPASALLTATASADRILTLCIALIALLTMPPCCLGIELGSFLADNMVLAREPLEARLWGWSDNVGETISVSIDGEEISEASATVQDDGSWTMNLPPREASAGPHTLTISGGGSASAVTLKNVAFGDVFLCSGQSNMEFSVKGAFNSDAEIVKFHQLSESASSKRE